LSGLKPTVLAYSGCCSLQHAFHFCMHVV